MANSSKIIPDLLMKALLDNLRRKGVLNSPGVEAAFKAVPRHLFLPNVPLDKVYLDEAIPLKHDPTGMLISSSSQPTMMAIMLDQAQLTPGLNVLEIGTASGYNAALIQHLVGDGGYVTSIELDSDLAKQAILNLQRANMSHVKVVQGDGATGYAPRAEYDRIIATVGVWDVPMLWWQQLKPQGRLIVPIWIDGVQVSAVFVLQPDGTYLSVDNRPCAFVYLRGEHSVPELRKQVGAAMYILGDDIRHLDMATMHLLLSYDHEMCHLESPLSAQEYWNGFQLYLMLNEPRDFVFAVFAVAEGHKAYGMDGQGIALISRNAATFATYHEKGDTHCFGGVEAFLAMQEQLDGWHSDGQPGIAQLRLRLIPMPHGEPTIERGKLYTRRDHYLHVWLEDVPPTLV
jgi:protein-L-isoaspartate(D-aspartate) O-methyltransferase